METGLTRRTNLPAITSDVQKQAHQVEQQKLHYNYLQLLCLLIGAQYTTVIAGRGTGKSQGVLAPKLHQLLTKLPRSSIVAVGTTYVQLLGVTLPALFEGLQALGYVENEDYWVRRFPPPKLGLKMPHSYPMDAQHAIFLRNPGTDCVSVLRLVGQDRPGSANGLSVSAILADEARLLNKKKLDNEVMAINRGGQKHYGDIAEHHSITFTTDMPTSQEAKWLFNERDECLKPQHQQAIQLILDVQLELYRERRKLKTCVRNTARLKRIAKWEQYLAELRRKLVHYATASSFANIHVLGMQYIKNAKRTAGPAAFKAAYLNIEPDGVENGYYPDFNPDHHYYDAIDYHFVDKRLFANVSFDDCRQDADLDHKQGLTIGMDYGSSFNCLHVGQRLSKLNPINHSGFAEVRHLKSFGVEYPYMVQDVVKQFTDYYQYFLKKEVTYVFDPTAVGKNGVTTMTYADEVKRALKAAGWRVKEIYLTQVPSHHVRYLAWGWCLREKDDRFPRQRFNRQNTKQSVYCMQHAKTRQGKNGFEKDKTDEAIHEINQATTTHYTDAVDIVFWYLTIIESNLQDLLPLMMGG